jgi:catecholate siderophore receptor
MNQKIEASRNIQSTWMVGFAVGAAAFTPFDGYAQTATPQGNSTFDLPTIDVQGTGESTNTLNAQMGSSRLPSRVQDIPQIVNVVPKEIIQEQNITTLEQALRNVPGITVAIGEANGGPNGDRFRIRGFEAIGDQYVDGLRDFGVYVRDSFNYEQVEVLKGPSTQSFGVGTVGGAINTTSKQARLGDSYAVDGSFGTGPLARGTFDINKQINQTTAFRVTGMANRQDLADRDGVKSDRWGIAASLGMGIGTDKTWYLNYFHQSNDRTPDYGVPMIGRTATSVRRPITEFGVPRSNYYGKDSDRDRSDVDLITSRFKMDATDWLTIHNDTRLSFYDRYYSQTTATCDQACANSFFAGGNPLLVYGAGGGATYQQKAWGFQNVTSAVAKFNTGFLRHEAVLGFDFMYQNNKRYAYSYSPSKGPIPRIWTPDTSVNYSILENPNNIRFADSTNYAFFASDRMWLTNWLSVLGGVRWDYFGGSFTQKTLTTSTTSDADATALSPKVSIIFEPIKDQNFYLSYGTASTMPFLTNGIAVDVTPINGSRANVAPEISTTYEAGTKLNFLNGRLGVTAALFQVTKDNSYYTDPTSGVMTQTGERQRVRGFEAGLTGRVTDNWTVNVAYAHMTSEIIGSLTGANVGNPVPGVPTNSGSLWTTYNLSPALVLPGRLLVGGGFSYRDGVYIRNDMMAEVPYSFSLDALISYEFENWRVALNAYNLTNRINYDSFFQGENANTSRVIPSAGRTVMLTVGAKF